MSSQPGDMTLPLTQQDSAQSIVPKSSDLRVDIVDASQLCGEIADRWEAICACNPHLISPYFDIEFTKAVARVRNDVEIAIVRNDDDEIISCVPYQRVEFDQAEPVGGLLNDVHGAIIASEISQVDVFTRVMRAAKLRSFRFHAVHKYDSRLDAFEFCELDSHYIDLRHGWSEYEQWARNQSTTIRRQGQKTRALEREVGPIRFEFNCINDEALEHLIELKRAKYQRTKTFDILSVDWAANLIREISRIDKPGFKGLLSTLYAGDALVAAHFGMMSGDILHYWFPVFDPRFSKYSPGTQLLLRVAQTACANGISKIDLGYGNDPYKYRFCNGHESVCCGKVVFSRMSFHLAKQQYGIRQRLKGMPMKPLAKSLLRSVFPGFGQWNFK